MVETRQDKLDAALPLSLHISISEQRLRMYDGLGQVLSSYAVSTAANGVGARAGSYCTPLGRHLIRAKIGFGQPENTVFVGRRPTGEHYSPALARQFPERDWILTRILWLSGCEPGFNRLGAVDTMRRYIYIHGSPDTVRMGAPGSHGCVRMRNADIVELFDRVQPYTQVLIEAGL
ncbi:MAG: L,D-transpeptidase [Pseudomonadota bacterium]